MKLYDIIIIVFLLFFALLGFKRGFFKSLVSFLGFIIVIVLSYNFKNIVGDFFVLNLPFIEFKEFLGGASTINIIMYQAIAFIIMSIIFGLVYKIIVTITGIFEKILKLTIVLGIPSKLLGLVVGFLEGYIILYLVLFFLVQPFINVDVYKESDYASRILENTPVLSSYAEKSLVVVNEIRDLTDKDNNDNLDLQIADLILKNNVTSKEVMQKLVDDGKIKINGIDEILNKYNEEVKNG